MSPNWRWSLRVMKLKKLKSQNEGPRWLLPGESGVIAPFSILREKAMLRKATMPLRVS